MVLFVKRRYVADILSGEKSVTFRAASSRLPSVGDVIALRCERHLPPFAHARIVELRAVRRADVTLADVRAAGHSSVAEWRAAVRVLYAGQRIVLLRFVLV